MDNFDFMVIIIYQFHVSVNNFSMFFFIFSMFFVIFAFFLNELNIFMLFKKLFFIFLFLLFLSPKYFVCFRFSVLRDASILICFLKIYKNVKTNHLKKFL